MSDEKAERVMQKVYYLDTVLFVPHYSKPHWWVCAGGMERERITGAFSHLRSRSEHPEGRPASRFASPLPLGRDSTRSA